jgi:hypothetical protein
MKKQLLPVHILAYILQPQHKEDWKVFLPVSKKQVTDFLDDYGDDELQNQFFDYIEQKGAFHPGNRCWNKKDTLLFWRLCVSLLPFILIPTNLFTNPA